MANCLIYLQKTSPDIIFALSFYDKQCWVMKLADMPSCLGGEEKGIN